MAVTAKARVRLRLEAITALEPAECFQIVKEMTAEVHGGGVSLLTSGLKNLGAQVHIERDTPQRLSMSITSGKRIIELCTFSARVSTRADGKTVLEVGGLETYKSTQSKFLMIIPTGPKMIAGMAPYKKFLDVLANAIQAKDPSAQVVVDVPAGG